MNLLTLIATSLRRAALMLVLVAMSTTGTAMAASDEDMQRYLEDWIDQYVESVGQSWLDSPIAPSEDLTVVRDQLKSSFKNYLIDRVAGKEISVSMAEILDKIESATHAEAPVRNKSTCQRTALAMASEGVNVSRELRGAAKTAITVLLDAIKGPTALLSKIKGELRETALELATELFSTNTFEVFGAETRAGNCSVRFAVIWKKTTGDFHFLILGDCSCREKSVPLENNPIELAQWSVRGHGIARWVGAEEEKRLSSGVEAKSTIRGKPKLDPVSINAACCKGGQVLSSGIHPFSDPRQAAAPCAGPKATTERRPQTTQPVDTPRPRPTTQGGLDRNRGGFSELDGAIPQIPDGALSEDQKMDLLTRSVYALRRIDDRRLIAQQELEDLQQRQAGSNPPTVEEMEAAREQIRTLDALQGKAKETLKRVEAMIEPSSDQASAGGATVIPASPQSPMLLTDRRAAIEEGRLIAACKD